MLALMKTLSSSLATLVLAGCASQPGIGEIGKAVQQATGARTAGASADPGSVASGGTGYLPLACQAAPAPGAVAQPGCK